MNKYTMIFLIIISISGIIINILTIWGVWAAGSAIMRLEEKWDFVYHKFNYSHSHRRYDESQDHYTLPVPFVTGGHKPYWKKELILAIQCQNELSEDERGASRSIDPKSGVSRMAMPAVAGRVLPISIPCCIIIVWVAVAIFSFKFASNLGIN